MISYNFKDKILLSQGAPKAEVKQTIRNLIETNLYALIEQKDIAEIRKNSSRIYAYFHPSYEIYFALSYVRVRY